MSLKIERNWNWRSGGCTFTNRPCSTNAPSINKIMIRGVVFPTLFPAADRINLAFARYNPLQVFPRSVLNRDFCSPFNLFRVFFLFRRFRGVWIVRIINAVPGVLYSLCCTSCGIKIPISIFVSILRWCTWNPIYM